MSDAIRGRTRSLVSAIVAGATLTVCATVFAQSYEPISPSPREPLAVPVPAAYHVRTRHLLLGTPNGVRKMEETAGGRLVDRGPAYAARTDTILRIRVDSRRERLWILDIGAVHVFDLTTNRRIRTVTLPNWIFSSLGDNCLPDLQLDEHGAAFVSDHIQPKLWRIDGDNFTVYERRVRLDALGALDVGFSALAITDGGVMFAAMAAPGLLWRIDTGTFRAEKVALSAPIHGACSLELGNAARSRDFTVFVLSAGRGKFDVRRVTMVPAWTVATVDTLPLGSVMAPAGLLASSGTLYQFAKDGALPSGPRLRGQAAGWALAPIHRDD